MDSSLEILQSWIPAVPGKPEFRMKLPQAIFSVIIVSNIQNRFYTSTVNLPFGGPSETRLQCETSVNVFSKLPYDIYYSGFLEPLILPYIFSFFWT